MLKKQQQKKPQQAKFIKIAKALVVTQAPQRFSRVVWWPAWKVEMLFQVLGMTFKDYEMNLQSGNRNKSEGKRRNAKRKGDQLE